MIVAIIYAFTDEDLPCVSLIGTASTMEEAKVFADEWIKGEFDDNYEVEYRSWAYEINNFQGDGGHTVDLIEIPTS